MAVHVASLGFTKLADGLIDPKLVLSWLLSSLGAPAVLIGLLVPVREAGALLPQLFISARIRAMGAAKYAWAGGSAVQGLAAAGIALTGLLASGAVAGVLIVMLLAVLALARSVCSASYKHVLGKTVEKQRRGRTTGLAGSVAAAGVLGFAAFLSFGPEESLALVPGAIALAALLWLCASALFTTLAEPRGSEPAEEGAVAAVRQNIGHLRDQPQLRAFILARGLLISTALAPPFLVTLSAGSLDRLGWMVGASALAALVSSYVWGRFADISSRKVLALAGAAAAAALAMAGLAGPAAPGWMIAALLFALMIAYHGVRLGRSTHLVDMATEEQRAGFTAVSNTVIGVLLLAGSAYGVIAAMLGSGAVIWVFAIQSALGGVAALRLQEVQSR